MKMFFVGGHGRAPLSAAVKGVLYAEIGWYHEKGSRPMALGWEHCFFPRGALFPWDGIYRGTLISYLKDRKDVI